MQTTRLRAAWAPRLALTLLAFGAAAHPMGGLSMPGPLPERGPRPCSEQDRVDVLGYDLALFLDVPAARIQGTCAITFQAAPGHGVATSLALNLIDALSVTSVERDGLPIDLATVTHAGDFLIVPLAPSLPEGAAPTTVTVTYGGVPGSALRFDTSSTGAPAVWTYSFLDYADTWWPCKDRQDDKATMTMRVEAPDAMAVVANGMLIDVTAGRPGHSITTWRSDAEIATYLVVLDAAEYVSWTDTYTALDGTTTMPVTHWAFPGRETLAMNQWAIVPYVLEFFAQAFGEYPFLDEKFSNVMTPLLGGGMEHQTAVTLSESSSPFVVVHETAHQWWGDSVTPTTSASTWLSEGFANYSHALYVEQSGLADYLARMRSLDRSTGDFTGTVHDPTNILNGTVYNKGAWVLHMLRWVLRPPGSTSAPRDPILDVLRTFQAERFHGTASSFDFEEIASRVSGQDLALFFEQWVHRPGRPLYSVGWCSAPDGAGSYEVDVHVQQTQAEPIFIMPVPVRITTSSGPTDLVVDNSTRSATYTFTVAEAPTAVEWDPDGWVLKRVSSGTIDSDGDRVDDCADGCPDVANPLQEDSDGDGTQDACEVGVDFDGDTVPNELDCAPDDDLAWTEPPGETLLSVTRESRQVVLRFTNPDTAPQRACFTDVVGGNLADLRRLRGPSAGTCVGSVGPGSDWVDTTPMPASGGWFLAWPWIGCPSPDDPCR